MRNRKEEIIRSMNGKLKPCPFCGGEFHLIHESYINKNNVKVHGYYWESQCHMNCLLYDILCEPFHMGAGDVDIKTGYVGEYGTRWNNYFETKEAKNDR